MKRNFERPQTNETINRMLEIEEKLSRRIDAAIQGDQMLLEQLHQLRAIELFDGHERLVHIEDKINALMAEKDLLYITEEPNAEIPDSPSNRIHFVRSIDWKNTGDMQCDPLLYFPELSDGHICIYHHWSEIRWEMIHKDDWIIIGGGGLFNVTNYCNRAIMQLLDASKNVIVWSCGQNHHKDRVIENTIDYERFYKVTVRDYGTPLEYLPCVSCMHPALRKKHEILREIGIVEHKDFPLPGFFEYDRITNSCSIESILNFIGESEVVLTSTWHGSYWAQLKGKKVILYEPWSDKFNYYKYPVVIYSGNLTNDIKKANRYTEALDEACEMNIAFCRYVIEQINN